MKTKPNKEEEKKKDRKRFWALLLLLLLLLLLFLLFQWKLAEDRRQQEYELKQMQFDLAIEKARKIADSIMKAKADSMPKTDSLEPKEPEPEPTQKPKKQEIISQLDSTPKPTDSIPPTPSILPPPGRYYKPVTLQVECGEPRCETEISIGDSLNAAKGKIEGYNKTGKVYFRAIDSAGNASSWEIAAYDMASDNNCAENSYPVPVKGKSVCIDAYEFPNKASEKPRNMVSHDAAVRLCESEGKRLCSTEEWQAACKGNSNLRYPYGNAYNQTRCATDLKSAKEPNRSGFAAHCRSYYGMYDMSGNLWEWTSSPAPREGLFLVAGGAWNTQNASSCTETKFSFYPQNEYPFVGFRCCK
jgi:hypothetical protein